jgi:hypothetical protein
MSEREGGPPRADHNPAVDAAEPPAATPNAGEPPVVTAQPGTPPAPEDEPPSFVPARVGCRTELRGWAGAHLHGAVRPRRRAAGRGRPPGRWC